MIADNGDTTIYASFGEPGPLGDTAPNDAAGSLDAMMAPAVTPAPYAEEFGGGESPFDQPQVSDPSFQPTLADMPNPTTSPLLLWFGLAAAGLLIMNRGRR